MPRKTKKASKTSKAKPDRLTCTAYHEAGHAVMSFYRHVPFRYVTIIENQESLGRVACRKLPPGIMADLAAGIREEKPRRRLEAEVDVLLAGGLAVKILGGRNPYQGADKDMATSVDWAMQINGSGEQATAYLAWRNLIVRQDLKNRWKQVEEVARALLVRKKLSRAEVKAILVPPPPRLPAHLS
jgi:hypothetical protein